MAAMVEILLGKIMIGDCIFGITKSTLRLDCGLRLVCHERTTHTECV